MKTLTLFLLALTPALLAAQCSQSARIFGQGQVDVQAVAGIFPTYLADRPETVIPPLQLGVRWMVTRSLSLGIFAGHSASRSREKILFDSIRGRWENTTYFLGLENGIHSTQLDNWDIYGGFSFFYRQVRARSSKPEFETAMQQAGIPSRRSRMAMTAYLGCRFALSAHCNILAELGYGVSLLKVGVGYQL